MSDKFNAYEYIAVIAPGSVVAFGASLAYPSLKSYIANDGITVGGLGIFIIMSFIIGHLIQGFGNIYEKCVWSIFSGMPTNWLRQPSQTLLSGTQLNKLTGKIAESHPGFEGPSKVSENDWFALTREIYATVQGEGKSERVDSFNRTYGLLRGIAVSFIISTFWAFLLFGFSGWRIILLLAVASALATYRMHRFGIHYARELFVQFVRI